MGTHRALGALMLVLAGCGDNFHPGGGDLVVSPLSSRFTDETGVTATFTVSLSNTPVDNIVVRLASTDSGEGSVSPERLTFRPDNSADGQTVTITGVDDNVADGEQSFLVRVGIERPDSVDVEVVNGDDDMVGVAVTPLLGLMTSETGTEASFTVALTSEPVASVFVPVASSDVTEGIPSTTILELTPADWDKPQTITVTGAQDTMTDGSVAYTIILGKIGSADLGYRMFDPDDVQLVNADDDIAGGTAGFIVTPTTGLVTSEAGTTAMFTVRLTSQPAASLSIAVTSSDISEGTVSPSSLSFTTSNWNTPQTVTVTGVDDMLTDNTQIYLAQLAPPVTTDLAYAALDPPDVTVSNTDNDTASAAGFTLEPSEGLLVSELGDADQFSIVLNTMPTGGVTINLSSSDTTEGTVLPTSVVFTSFNWNTPQVVEITGVNDATPDGNIAFSVVTSAASSTDPAYNGLAVPDVSVTNLDNDIEQVYVKSRPRLSVSESGQSTTFRVRLTVQPTATVTCTLSSSDTTEGTVSPTTLTFQPNSFGFQTVTVTGVDDAVGDGDQPFSIILAPCTSTDLAYQGANPRDVNAINRDND